jgi:membrane protein
MAHERSTRPGGLTLVIAKESIQSFIGHNDFEMSVALASYGFFSIIPLLFFVGYLFSSYSALPQGAIEAVESLISHLFPTINGFSIRNYYFSTSSRFTWGFIGLAMIFVSLMSVSDSLRTAFSKIFNVSQKRPFVRIFLANMAATTLALALSVILIMAEMAFASLTRPFTAEFGFFKSGGNFIPSLVVASICMVTIYLVFSPAKLKVYRIITVALITAALLVIMKNLFSRFLTFNPDYGIAFGSLKTLFIMIIWVYYCFLVILLGAEIMANFEKRDALLLKGLFLHPENGARIPEAFFRKHIRVYHEGEILFSEGEKGNNMYFILSGAVSICRGGHVIRTMKKDDYFGEMSMLLDAPRTATVRVEEDGTRLILISQDNFEAILREGPEIVLAILKEMTLRLKLTNNSL